MLRQHKHLSQRRHNNSSCCLMPTGRRTRARPNPERQQTTPQEEDHDQQHRGLADLEGHFIFPVDKEAYSFDNGTLTLKGKIRSGSAKVDHTTETGQEIFTVT